MNTIKQSAPFKALLTHKGLQNNLSVSPLVEQILARKEGTLTATGAVRATTGKYTGRSPKDRFIVRDRSEEHTSELQSRGHLVCRLLLEKKKKIHKYSIYHT